MTPLITLEQYNDIRNTADTYIIYKHSPTCSLSMKAMSEMKTVEEEKIIDIYILDVLNTWDLKYDIETDLEIRHESPQVLIFKNTKLIDHASHQSVTARRVRNTILGRNDTRSS